MTSVRDGDGPAALEVGELSMRFGGVAAVDKLTMSVGHRTVTGLIGPNGAGKTTTFNMCNGLQRPTSGTVALYGQDVTALAPQARAQLGMGRTFQQVQLCDSLTLRENVALGLEARRSGRRLRGHLWAARAERLEVEAATSAALELCGIAELKDIPTRALSTGQRRLTELARAVAAGHRLLLLDEPSSGLDVTETAAFGALLETLVRERDVTILLVEHDMALVMSLCTYIYVLDFGQLIFDGEPREVQRSAIVRAAYLGAEP